jgi:hypothetical protein
MMPLSFPCYIKVVAIIEKGYVLDGVKIIVVDVDWNT